LVVRLDDEVLAVRAQIRNQIDVAAIARDAPLLDERGPWNVATDQGTLVRRKQIGVPIAREDGEERLLVRDLAAQRVRDADGARVIRVEQGAAVGFARKDVVDQNATVDEIDARAARVQTSGPRQAGRHVRAAGRYVLEVARVGDDRRHAGGDEGVAKQLELAVGRHLAPVDDGDLRRRGGAAPFAVARDE